MLHPYIYTLLHPHRDGTDIFSVNALHFHNYNTFASGGSDGVVTYWDKDARHKLVAHEAFKRQCPITDVKFNPMVSGWLLFCFCHDLLCRRVDIVPLCFQM